MHISKLGKSMATSRHAGRLLSGTFLAILALSHSCLADLRGPYLSGRDSGTNLALIGFFLSLSIAAAGIWFVWYRRRGGSRAKSWIIASIIAVGLFVFIGVVTALV